MPYPRECPPDCRFCKYQWIGNAIFILCFWTTAITAVILSFDKLYQR